VAPDQLAGHLAVQGLGQPLGDAGHVEVLVDPDRAQALHGMEQLQLLLGGPLVVDEGGGGQRSHRSDVLGHHFAESMGLKVGQTPHRMFFCSQADISDGTRAHSRGQLSQRGPSLVWVCIHFLFVNFCSILARSVRE